MVHNKNYLKNGKFNDEYNIVCAGLPKKCMYKKDDSGILYYKTYEEDSNGKFQEVEKTFNINDLLNIINKLVNINKNKLIKDCKLSETEAEKSI